MPNVTSNEPTLYNNGTQALDTGANNVPPVSGVDPSLTVDQNAASDKFYASMDSTFAKDNPWLKTNQFQVPYNTRLQDTLRYNDPKYGYDPFNTNIETQYGDRQGALSKWGNNLVKFGANTVGGFIEGLSMLPIVADAAVSGDVNKIENNKLTNGISDWLASLDTKFPNYETTFGQDHPVLNYVPFIGHSGDSWGGLLTNLGYTVGSIGSAVVQDLAVGAITGGAGDVPLIGSQLSQATGKLGKIFSGGSKVVDSFNELLKGGTDVEEALNQVAASTKAVDNVRYGIGLSTSALSLAMLEANKTQSVLNTNLKKQFFDEHGFDATGEDADKITQYTKEGANAVLYANFGIQLLAESAIFKSLLAPRSIAQRTIAANLDDNIGIQLAKKTIPEVAPDAVTGTEEAATATETTASPKATTLSDDWEAINPAKGFKGILQRVGNSQTFKTVGIEGAQQGGRFVVQTAADNFYKHKFDNDSINGVDNFVGSLATGLHDVFTTGEGVNNLIIGALSGAIIGPAMHGIQEKLGLQPSLKDRLAYTLKTLNDNPLSGLFTDDFNTATSAYKLANDITDSHEAGDKFATENNKFQQLFNFVNAGVRTNRFDAQIARLEGIKDLKESDQRALLKIDDPNFTKADLDNHVNAVITKANEIKADIQKVDAAFPNKYNYKTDFDKYNTFNDLKDHLALALSEVRDNRDRMTSIGADIYRSMNNVDSQKIVNLTNEGGIAKTVQDFEGRIKELNSDEELFKGTGAGDLEGIRKERNFLTDQVSRLKSNNTAAEHIETLHNIYNYYNNGNSLPDSRYNADAKATNINYVDTINIHNQAQDIFKLGEGVNRLNEIWNNLADKKKFAEFTDQVTTYRKAQEDARTEENAARAAAAIPAAPGDDVKSDETNQEIDEKGNPIETGKPANEGSVEDATLTSEEDKPFDPDEEDKIIAAKKAATKIVSAKDQKKRTDLESQLKILQALNDAEKQHIKDQFLNELGQTEDVAEEQARKGAASTPTGKKIAALQKKIAALDGGTDEPGLPSKVAPITKVVAAPKITTVAADIEAPAELPSTGDKPAAPVKAIVQTGKKGDKKYEFNPMNFFNRIFSKDKKNSGAEANAKRETLLNKTADEVAQTATIKTTESATSHKFGKYDILPNTGDKIYYTGYHHDISLEFDGKSIGLFQPADRLAFKRGEDFVPLYEIKPEEYEEITGNSPDTYNDFINEMNAYKAVNDKIMEHFAAGKTELSNEDIRGLFNIGLDYSVNPYTNTAKDATLIKNLNYDKPGNVVVSLPMVRGEDGTFERSDPAVIGKEKLSPEQFTKLEKFISDNIETLKGNKSVGGSKLDSRYFFIAALPNGEYAKNSIFTARPVHNAENLDELMTLLKTPVHTADEAKQVNSEMQEKFFIADSTSPKGKGAKMFLTVDEKGRTFLNILNKSVTYQENGVEKEGYNRRLQIMQAPKAEDINSMINAINDTLSFQKTKDRALNKMDLVVTKEDFKSGILPDESAKYEDVTDKLSVPIEQTDKFNKTAHVFNPELYILPAGQKAKPVTKEAAPKAEVKTETKAATKEVPVETKTSTATAEAFLKDKEGKAAARTEAKSQSSEDINNEFLGSLGCK